MKVQGILKFITLDSASEKIVIEKRKKTGSVSFIFLVLSNTAIQSIVILCVLVWHII